MDWRGPCRRVLCDGAALTCPVGRKGRDSGAQVESAGAAILGSSAWGQKTMPSFIPGLSVVPGSPWPHFSHSLEEGSLPLFSFLAKL